MVRGDVASITNSRWSVSLSGVTGIPRAPVRAINDFAACAFSLTTLGGLSMAYAMISGRSASAMRAEDVTRAQRTDPHAAAAIDLFIDHLSAVIGDMVLAFGAWDGVFLTGPIVRVLRERLMRPDFRRRMEAHGSYARRLHEVPIALVQRDDLNLRGAAAALVAAQARETHAASSGERPSFEQPSFAATGDRLSARA